MHQRPKATPKAWRAEWHLVLVALGLGFAFWPSSERTSVTQGVQEEARERGAVELVSRGRGPDEQHAPLSIGTMPIQSIAVGQRVLGEDPLIDDAERAGWVEPQWDRWLQISLLMRKDTGDELRIELLRPEEWLTERWQFVASRPEDWCVTALDVEPVEDATAGLTPLLDQCGTPWRAYRQEMAAAALELAAIGYELVGLTLELDLHEIGAVGEAMVLDIQPAPPVRLGAGRVVTGKFSHKSGDVIDLVLADADQEPETIGTTSNHPFWSEDRRDYVQAGSLEEGERVLTFAGDTKRVVSKLARPGPQPVYNLEVHGEHVYHVGKDGVLVHNEYTKDFGGGVSYRDSLDEIGAPNNALSRATTQIVVLPSNQVVSQFDTLGNGRYFHSTSPGAVKPISSGGFRTDIPTPQAAFHNNRFGRGVYLADSPFSALAERGGVVLQVDANVGRSLNILNRGPIYDAATAKAIARGARKHGFDSIITRSVPPGGGVNTVIFDPRNVRAVGVSP